MRWRGEGWRQREQTEGWEGRGVKQTRFVWARTRLFSLPNTRRMARRLQIVAGTQLEAVSGVPTYPGINKMMLW
jgi:hypothetical protein